MCAYFLGRLLQPGLLRTQHSRSTFAFPLQVLAHPSTMASNMIVHSTFRTSPAKRVKKKGSQRGYKGDCDDTNYAAMASWGIVTGCTLIMYWTAFR